jgi:hypothetical protein
MPIPLYSLRTAGQGRARVNEAAQPECLPIRCDSWQCWNGDAVLAPDWTAATSRAASVAGAM